MTFVVLEFTKHLNIKEFQVSKSFNTEIQFWIPDMNDPAFALTTNAATRIKNELNGASSYKLEEHFSGMLSTSWRIDSSTNDGESLECSLSQCVDFAPKRIIIAAKENKDFFLCGFAVMAEKMSCPASAEQCKHVNLEKLSTTISDMTFPTLGDTIWSDQFLFTDSITDQCALEGVGNGCTSSI